MLHIIVRKISDTPSKNVLGKRSEKHVVIITIRDIITLEYGERISLCPSCWYCYIKCEQNKLLQIIGSRINAVKWNVPRTYFRLLRETV
jgi:hypothetical protein